MPKQHYHILLAFMRHVNKPEKRINCYGLCTNLSRFLGRHFIDENIQFTIQDALKMIFTQNGWNGAFPFNEDDSDYMAEANNKEIFQNPRRLAFISTFLSGGYRHLITC